MSPKPCVCNKSISSSNFSEISSLGLRPQYPGLWRESIVNTVIDQGPGLPPLEVKKGDRLYASFRNAHVNVSNLVIRSGAASNLYRVTISPWTSRILQLLTLVGNLFPLLT